MMFLLKCKWALRPIRIVFNEEFFSKKMLNYLFEICFWFLWINETSIKASDIDKIGKHTVKPHLWIVPVKVTDGLCEGKIDA